MISSKSTASKLPQENHEHTATPTFREVSVFTGRSSLNLVVSNFILSIFYYATSLPESR